MARRLFFVDSIHSGRAEVSGEAAQHLTRVLRVEPGERFQVSDNQSLYLAEVESARKSLVVFRLMERLEPEPATVRVTLFAALIKFERFEWMVEKATELGVERIVPVETTRSERGLERAARARLARWRRIALESCQQSRRSKLPEITEPVALGSALADEGTLRVALDEEAGAVPLLAILPKQHEASDRVLVLAGPEGGWTDDERRQTAAAGWAAVSLGPQILRAETAATAALAIVSNWWPWKAWSE